MVKVPELPIIQILILLTSSCLSFLIEFWQVLVSFSNVFFSSFDEGQNEK